MGRHDLSCVLFAVDVTDLLVSLSVPLLSLVLQLAVDDMWEDSGSDCSVL